MKSLYSWLLYIDYVHKLYVLSFYLSGSKCVLFNARFETILKVFKALNAKINFNVELLDQKV